jgi:hypothetical protein
MLDHHHTADHLYLRRGIKFIRNPSKSFPKFSAALSSTGSAVYTRLHHLQSNLCQSQVNTYYLVTTTHQRHQGASASVRQAEIVRCQGFTASCSSSSCIWAFITKIPPSVFAFAWSLIQPSPDPGMAPQTIIEIRVSRGSLIVSRLQPMAGICT